MLLKMPKPCTGSLKIIFLILRRSLVSLLASILIRYRSEKISVRKCFTTLKESTQASSTLRG